MTSTIRRRALLLSLLVSLASPLAAQAPAVLHLTFLGDIMAHDVNLAMSDYRGIYAAVGESLLADDLTIANFEMPIDPTRPVSGYPLFNGNSAYLRAAVESGVDVFSTANNHAFDGGEEGIFQTLRAIQDIRLRAGRALAFSGTRGNPHRAFSPQRILVNGFSVGFIAAAQEMNMPGAAPWVNVVDYRDGDAAGAFLRFVQEQSARFDLLIVSYHGDREYASEPSPGKRAFFHQLLEAGATIVFAHHPHVMQGCELVRVGGVDRLIMYSMGNFISGMTWFLDPRSPDVRAPTGESYMLAVVLVRGPQGCDVKKITPIPIANWRNGSGEMVVMPLRDLASGAAHAAPEWQSYYAQRLAVMERFLEREAGGFAAAR